MTENGDFSRFGPYLIVRTSGSGGMGRVELALTSEGQSADICVLKRMHLEERAPEQVARFEREGRIAVRLVHENIARTFRVEQIEGEICLAQEFVEGVALARLAKQAGAQRIPIADAVRIVREVANALSYAHDFGGLEIVHRDVTPENVMLSFAGDVKLIDFGISRSRVDGTLTNVGAIVGRRAYIAPEAWTGAKADRRVDVYALGVVLWELLAGRRLEEVDENLWRDRVPDPTTFRADLPVDLAAVTLRALAPNPTDRYQSAAELCDALQPFAASEDTKAALVTLLRFYFNVDATKEILDERIEEARRVLVPTVLPLDRRGKARRALAISVGAVAVLVSATLMSGLRRHRGLAQEGQELSAAPALRSTAALASGSQPVERGPHGKEVPRIARAAPTRRPDTDARQHRGDDLLRRANDQWDDGHVANAETLARQAAAAGAGAQAHVLLGSIYMGRAEFGSAERELAEAVKLDPRDGEAARLLADVRRTRSEQGE